LLSHLASIFAPSNGIAGSITLWLNGLRLIAIGFDFRVFPFGPARGVPACSHRIAAEQRLPLRELP
jgi:hypothetical protein